MINIKANINNSVLLNSGQGEDPGTPWVSSALLTINATETIQFVSISFQSGMLADFSDIRFVLNPDGTAQQKLYLEQERVSYVSSTSAIFKVSHLTAFRSAGATFYAIWGNPESTLVSRPYRVAHAGNWITNNFDRGVNYDVQNVFAGADYLLDGAGDASQEANWSAKAQMPIFQSNWGIPQDSDWNKVYVAYKYDADDNIHAGSPTSKSALKYSLDFGATWSARSFIYDPDALHRSTSSTSLAIPTTGITEVTLTIEAGKPWVAGDVARVFNDETHYFWITITSYSGTTLVGNRISNTGTGTFSSWVISQKYGATNTVITTVKKSDGVVRLIAAFSKYNFYDTEGGGSAVIRVFSSYTDLDSSGNPTTWSTPVMISDNSWANVGGQAITSHDGIVWMTYHENAITTVDYSSSVAYSRDYGLTWNRIRTVAAGAVKLDETDLLQLYDDSLQPINQIRALCRNEDSGTSWHQHKYLITWDENSASSSSIEENDWYDSTVSRYTSVRCPDKRTVFWGGGDATGKQVYSPDNLASFHPVPIATLTTGIYSARRVYYTMAVHPDGRKLDIWSSNKQPNGSDLYISYSDWTRNNLYTDTTNTLTDYAGVRNRPRFLNPGIQVGQTYLGYRTSSTTSISVPTGAGQQRTLTVATGLAWVGGDLASIVYTSNNGVRFTATVISYNSSNGQLVVEWLSNTGTGTQATWQINRGVSDNTGNLLANQAFLSKVIGNGQLRNMKATLRVGTYGTGGVTGGAFGMKRFETRAVAVVTITNAGAAGDVISIRWKKSATYTGLFGGMGKVATYTVQAGDNIAAVVTGLVNSARLLDVCKITASDATTLTVAAPLGNNTAINGQSLTIEVTGSVAGSSGTFSGGVAIEGSTGLANVNTFDNANNIVRMEQNNDNYSEAMTITDGPNNYIIEWNSTHVQMQNETTTREKISSEGSGVPNWEGHLIFFLTTSASSVQGLLELYSMKVEPLDQTSPTVGAIGSGSWTERSDGLGLN